MGKRIDETRLSIVLSTNDFGISPPHEMVKRYILRGIEELPEWLDLYQTVARFKELGKAEWEYLLAFNFLYAIETAESLGDLEADVTRMFQHDYSDRSGKKVTKEQVTEHLMKHFTVVEENDTTIYIKFNL